MMDGTKQFSDYHWRQHLDELVVQSELRIIEAEHRIEDHLKLWPLVAADGVFISTLSGIYLRV